jgi:hypothetical protein
LAGGWGGEKGGVIVTTGTDWTSRGRGLTRQSIFFAKHFVKNDDPLIKFTGGAIENRDPVFRYLSAATPNALARPGPTPLYRQRA